MPARRNTAAALRPKTNASKKALELTLPQVARRLHNTICQSITGARFMVSAIEKQLPKDARGLRDQFQQVEAALDHSCVELRALIKELRAGSGNSA